MSDQAGRRVSTGIPGADEVLHGGLLPTRSYMLRGEAGTGKTILGFHYLTAGVAAGEACLYVAFEEPTEDIRANAATLGFDVAGVVVEARHERPAADISVASPDEAPARAPETLELALDELVENAVVHSDRAEPTVEVEVTVGPDAVEVRVADDGPGLDDIDREALLRGTESPLEHTQGLGLWLVRWSVESVGGDIDIAGNDPRGTVVRVSLPRAEQ